MNAFFLFSSNLLDDSEEEEAAANDNDHSYGSNFNSHPTRPLDPSHSHRNCRWKVTREKVRSFYNVALIAEIDGTMKELTDNMLHVVKGLNVRLLQLRSTICRLENAVDDLMVSAEYNYGRTDGKLRYLENILREVKDGVQFLREKQEIAETQLQLAKLQVSKGSLQSKEQSSALKTDAEQQTPPSALYQSHQSLPNSGAILPAHYQNPTPTAAPAVTQFPTEIPSIPLTESYYLQPGQTSETTCQQYHMPPIHQGQAQSPLRHQPYQLTNPSRSSSLTITPLSQLHPSLRTVNSQNHLPFSQHPEERFNMPHSYLPAILESSSQPIGGASTQQFYVGCHQQMDSQLMRRPYSNFPADWSQTSGPVDYSDMHPCSGSSYPHGNSIIKPFRLSTSPSALTGENGYAELPKAQILPCALPIASILDSGSDSGGRVNKVPIDDVVEKVTAMGFRRDLVRGTVKKHTENGQSMDLNVVLDKLMNNENAQPQRGWSAR